MKAHALPAPVRAAARPLAAALSAAALLFLCILALMYRTDAATGVRSGIYTCLNTLVPALFPFVLLACLLSGSRAAGLLFRPLAPVLRHVFRLPPCAAPAIVFGLTAGYPTGAKIAASLYDGGRLTRGECARLLCFCTAPGYAFAASYTGTILFGSAHTGLLFFLACLLAPLITGVCLARFAPKPVKTDDAVPQGAGSVTDAVRSGVSAMVSMCGFVVVFSALLAVLHGSGLFQTLTGLLARCGLTVPDAGAAVSFFLEVTAGATHSAYWHTAPALVAFGLGFGGVCIHMQIFSFFRGGFPMRRTAYLLSRLLNGLLAAACYRALAFFFPAAESAAAAGEPLARASAAGSTAASAALLALSAFFLAACVKKGRPEPFKTGRALPRLPRHGAPIRFTNSWWKSVPQNGTMDVSLKRRPPSCSDETRKEKTARCSAAALSRTAHTARTAYRRRAT